jgi:hypothetical protein
MFGLVDLGTLLGLSDARYQWAMSLEASWGSLFTFLVAGAFTWIGVVPGRPVPALLLLALVASALLVAAAVFADPGPAVVAAVVAVSAGVLFLLLRPGRPVPRWSGAGRRPWPVVVALGVPLWLGYAWLTATAASVLGRDAGDETMGVDHWPVQVALGLAVAVGSGLMLAWPELAVWRWPFALTAAFVAYATLVFPDRAGAMPHPLWGVAIALWGVLLLVLFQTGRRPGPGAAGP